MIESPSTNEHIIRKVPGSNPGLKTVYSDCQSSWFPSQPPGPYQNSIQSAPLHSETLITTLNKPILRRGTKIILWKVPTKIRRKMLLL
jgi:hypothetical protein